MKNVKWIWADAPITKNQYVSIKGTFSYRQGKCVLKIAADMGYIAYLNGKRVAFGAFPNWRDEKYYDEIDITSSCLAGINELRIVGRYEGISCATHINDGPGVWFYVENENNILIRSNNQLVAGIDNQYVQGNERFITWQLGFTTCMRTQGDVQYKPCVEISKQAKLLPRPVKKLIELPKKAGDLLNINGKQIYDLGKEYAGYIYLKVKCSDPVNVKVTYGEHLKDGYVRYLIGGRDFSFDFECQKGMNEFEQLFVRMAGRYLEVLCDKDVEIEEIGIIPVEYPVTLKGHDLQGLDGDIYDICVRTLQQCMHEHYEDCPWREQALYALDSRNQMLCGYHVFNETEFQRANLVFISKGQRKDGLLELTYPAENTPAIPVFSLMYPLAVMEYINYTGDTSILNEVAEVIQEILFVFANRIDETKLIKNFDAPYWNFYEWTDGNFGEGALGSREKRPLYYDLILNSVFVYILEKWLRICDEYDLPQIDIDLIAMRGTIVDTFFDEEENLFHSSTGNLTHYSQLGNSVALLIGLGNEITADRVKNDATLIPVSLSMSGFVYDALLAYSTENQQYILDDIRSKYGKILEEGSTTVWETIKGESDFGNAGSLCHGWSAIPIYYYNILVKREY